MNRILLPVSLVTLVGLLVASPIARSTVYTFDVDASSGIGTGSFAVDLPDSWPGNIGQSTLIRAAWVRGFSARGDKWVSLTVSLNEFIEQPNNAGLFGTSRRSTSLNVPAGGVGATPVDAVDNLPGVTRRAISVTQGGIRNQRQSPRHQKAVDTFHELLYAGSHRAIKGEVRDARPRTDIAGGQRDPAASAAAGKRAESS
jgi:hypothetical protein